MGSDETPYFDPTSVPSGRLYSDVGRTNERPFMILATIAETSLGDLLAKICFACTVKAQFDHARLIVRYRDVRPYSRACIDLASRIDHAEAIRGERPKWLHRWWPDCRLWHPLANAIKGTGPKRDAFFDLVLTDWMMNARTVGSFEHAARLRIPPARVDELTGELIDAGVIENAPFVVMHYRSENYPLKGRSTIRTADRNSYDTAIDHVISTLGCQVVLLGHPEMEPFAKREGLVDLSRMPKSFLLQAFAVSRARFMLGGPSGPVALGWGLGTPTGAIDCTDWNPDWGSPDNVFLTHEITTPDGRVLRNQALADSGLYDSHVMRAKLSGQSGFTVRKNSGAELCAVADHLHARTRTVAAWRPEQDEPEHSRPNSITLPLMHKRDLPFLDV